MSADRELDYLLEKAENAEGTHVVFFISAKGVHMLDGNESACELIKRVIEDEQPLFEDQSEVKVMPRAEFIAGLKSLQEKGSSHAK